MLSINVIVFFLQDYDAFDVANEDDELEEFLGIPRKHPKVRLSERRTYIFANSEELDLTYISYMQIHPMGVSKRCRTLLLHTMRCA